MSRPLCSVVFSTYQRAHLLTRSLEAYARQDFDNAAFELVVVDDHSRDGTRELVLDWSATTKIKATVLTPAPKASEWQDCGVTLNHGIRASLGENVILTHPEVIPGRASVRRCVEALREKAKNSPFGVYACCKCYYLSPGEQERIDTVPWKEEGVLALRKLEGFYGQDSNHPDYSHETTDRVATPGFRFQTWESFLFGGLTRDGWKKLGGMLETRTWGAVDIAFMHRRRVLGIPNHTCPEEDAIVCHQNHDLPDDVKTDRDHSKWQRELSRADMRREVMCHPHVDFL